MGAAELLALALSLRVAALCVACSLLPGVAVAWLLARRKFRGRALLDAVVHLPLVLPPVVVGYLLLAALGRGSPLGGLLESLGLRVAFTPWAAVLASAVMGFPLLVRAARLGIESVDGRLVEAARSLGASPLRAFLTVTLPLALPGILTGALLCFARSLGEFGATIAFAGNIAGSTRTLPLAIYSAMHRVGGEASALRLVGLSVAASLLALGASELLARRMRRRLGGA